MKSTIYISKNKIKENFKKFNNIGTLNYPLKANSNKNIINILNNVFEYNNKFLISCIDDYKILKSENIPVCKMSLINPFISEKDIKYLYKKGLRDFVFEDLESIKKFEKYANLKEVNISIRLSISEIFNIYTFIGCDLKNCIKILNYLKGYNKIGISFYLIPEFKNKQSMIKALNYIKYNFSNYIDFISIGGIRHNNLTKKIIDLYKNEINLSEIKIEPGQELLKGSMVLKSKIIKYKDINNTKTLIISNGIYSGFLDKIFYDKKFYFFIKYKNKKVKIFNKNKNLETIYICGSSSYSNDCIGKYYIKSSDIDKLRKTKYIYVKNVDSYFSDFFVKCSKNIRIKYKII